METFEPLSEASFQLCCFRPLLLLQGSNHYSARTPKSTDRNENAATSGQGGMSRMSRGRKKFTARWTTPSRPGFGFFPSTVTFPYGWESPSHSSQPTTSHNLSVPWWVENCLSLSLSVSCLWTQNLSLWLEVLWLLLPLGLSKQALL